MKDHAVVIVGGGPTGLMLAGELALADIDVAIIERRVNQELVGWRAGGLHALSIELFDQRGIADRFLAQGQVAQVAGFAWIRLDISDFPTPHPYGLALKQSRIERILADWLGELAVPIHRGREVTGIAQHDTGVDIELADGKLLRADYLVGCDGGRSLIRKSAGIDFPGWEPTTSCLIAEIEVDKEPQWGLRRDRTGTHSFSRLADGGPARLVVTERHVGQISRAAEPTLHDLSEALIAVCGIHSPTNSRSWQFAVDHLSYEKSTVCAPACLSRFAFVRYKPHSKVRPIVRPESGNGSGEEQADGASGQDQEARSLRRRGRALSHRRGNRRPEVGVPVLPQRQGHRGRAGLG